MVNQEKVDRYSNVTYFFVLSRLDMQQIIVLKKKKQRDFCMIYFANIIKLLFPNSVFFPQLGDQTLY